MKMQLLPVAGMYGLDSLKEICTECIYEALAVDDARLSF